MQDIVDHIHRTFRPTTRCTTRTGLRELRSRARRCSRSCFPREPTAPIPDDVALRRGTADAFKHFKLDRASAMVADADAEATISTGCGAARCCRTYSTLRLAI